MMKVIKVRLGERSYNIHIGSDILRKRILFAKSGIAPGTPLFVITNKKVSALYGAKLRKVLESISKKIVFYEVPDSEKAKSFPIYIKTVRRLARFAKKTKPVVFAFGGGVTGDLTGFVASSFRRGVPYVQIPTTLLAQVDSAVGGKVAIDIKEAKNIVGNFYQPKMVICDLELLRTLPAKEVQNGLAEIIKYGIIKDKKLFTFLEKNIHKALTLDKKTLEHVVYKSCSIKAKVVAKDEFDIKDKRAILNFGHTIGHAIEAASRYSGSVPHGKAVAAGMLAASLMAFRIKMLEKSSYEKICRLIKKVYPKTKMPHIKLTGITGALSYDKKFTYGVNRFILPKKIGQVEIVDKIPENLIKSAVEKTLKQS